MSLEFELAGSQIDGARDYQEDAFLITNLTDANGKPSALAIVADGMGGHAAGNVASNMAVQAFNKHVSANYPTDNITEVLEQAVIKANNSITETVAETPALRGMGCTMVAAILEGGRIIWASVGDSHLYLVRNKELTKKNADHSYGGFLDRMKTQGTPIEPEPGLSRNMLMSAITGDEINEVDVNSVPFDLKAGDRIIICSDGLDTLSSGKIIQYSEWSGSPKECADALMQAVEDANMPRQDNTTAVVVNIKEASAAAAKPLADVQTNETEPVTRAVNEKPVATSPPTYEEPAKSKSGMMIVIAAVVLIVIGAGVFFNKGKKADTPSKPVLVEDNELAEELVINTNGADEDVAGQKVTETVAAAKSEAAVAGMPATAQTPEVAKVASKAAGSTFQDNLSAGGKGPKMVVIPAGKYLMGSSSSRYSEEKPRHEVTVNSFAVSQYEITFAEYDLFAEATDRKKPDSLYMERATHPAIFIIWDDAYHYTKWLSEQTGERYRLPNEAEWEYMAGSGKKSPFWWGYDEEPNRAHCFGCGTDLDPRKPTRVGSFKPNPFNVYDTAGNVSEWVHDCWHDNYKNAPKFSAVWEGGDCALRVTRGGAYSTPPQSIRSQKRDKFKSDQPYDHIGIRVVREIR